METENKEKEQLRREWYNSEPVMFEIVKNLVGKETMFIGDFAIRNIKAHMIKFLVSNMNRYHFYSGKMNLYNSLSSYFNMPMFSYNREERRRQQTGFNQNFKTYMTGYDFLFDIDCEGNPQFSYATAYQIKEIFDKYKIKYYLLFSAGKNNGFHIRIAYEDLPVTYKTMGWDELCKLFKKFAYNFKMINDFEFIDDSIFDLRRISKCPYSCVYPHYLIALPLSDEQFNNFDIGKMTVGYWLRRTDEIKNRGLLKRDGNPENFKKLVEEYVK